jgi:hypothetical protein
MACLRGRGWPYIAAELAPSLARQELQLSALRQRLHELAEEMARRPSVTQVKRAQILLQCHVMSGGVGGVCGVCDVRMGW